MATSRIAIGNKVISNKTGNEGTITKIITKSTGYILVTINGKTFGDMAHNYTGIDGLPLKAKPGFSSAKTINNAVNSFATKLSEAEYCEHKF